MVRWWAIGLFFTGINIPILLLLDEIFKLPWLLSTLIAAELATLLRFPLNDRWVFGYPRPSWKRLWQYHAANFSSLVIWLIAANLFPAIVTSQMSVNLLSAMGLESQTAAALLAKLEKPLAAILATCFSVGWSMATNFLWIWRKKGPNSNEKPAMRSRGSAAREEPIAARASDRD